MLPETVLDNALRSPNNNSGANGNGGGVSGVSGFVSGFGSRNRASLCLSPVSGAQVTLDPVSKRRSWCGTPTSSSAANAAAAQQMLMVKRYGELGQFKPRSDLFGSDNHNNHNQHPSAAIGLSTTYFTDHHDPRHHRLQPSSNGINQMVSPRASPGTPPPCHVNNNPFTASAIVANHLNRNRNHQRNGHNGINSVQQLMPRQRLDCGRQQEVLDVDTCGEDDYHSRSESRESLVSSNGAGSEGGSEDSGDTGDYGAACDIGLVERLRRSHPIWFLPGIQRAGAFHLLQGKEEGVFVVRQSSQSKTMALSVRLPPDKGPYIEHYLIQSSDAGLGLETSENRFEDIPALIAHYANCCDELPVQLLLPKSIREATSRHQLSSLALLGSEFWRYSPPPSNASSPDADLALNLNPLMSTFKAPEPSTPLSAQEPKPARPKTLNLATRINPPDSAAPVRTIPALKNEQATRTPPPPPPRWSKPSTPQNNNNNFTVTTTFTIQMNADSPKAESAAQPMEMIVHCDPKRMSPEGKTSTLSSKGSLRRRNITELQQQILSPTGSSILSPNSDPSSILSPDTLSPLMVGKTTRQSRRARQKASKHYQESDILESPTVYYRSNVGDKISDYEDVWTNEQQQHTFKSNNINNNNLVNSKHLASPDLLQHTGNLIALGNNALSPTDVSSSSSSVAAAVAAINESNSNCSTPTAALPNSSSSTSHLITSTSFQSPITSSTELIPASTPTSTTATTPTTSTPGCQQPPLLKQNSPFYAEPADSLAAFAAAAAAACAGGEGGARSVQVATRLHRNGFSVMQHHRHSNPVMVAGVPGLVFSPVQERIEAVELNGVGMSSSVDNLSPRQRGNAYPLISPPNSTTAASTAAALKRPDVKHVPPPIVKPRLNDTWQLDNGWRFMGNECDIGDINMDSSEPDYDSDWPATIPTIPLSPYTMDPESSYTLEQILAKRLPCVRQTSELFSDDDACRMSSYDNVDLEKHRGVGGGVPRPPPSEISELTEFSEPWNEISQGITTETDDSFSEQNSNPPPKLASINRSRSFRDRLDPLISASKLQCIRNNKEHNHESKGLVGAAIRTYALDLSKDKTTTFAQNIDNFIACTCESKESNPQIAMRNMRQFMSGMKNYLVKHGEKEFNREVEKERNKLKATEFLNLDAILEGVLHILVVKPLKGHLQKLFIDHYTKTGAILLLADNIKYGSTRPLSELSIKPKISLPTEAALQTIGDYLKRLQSADSPLEKLEFLLAAIATIFNSVKASQLAAGSGKHITLSADDFLPIFVWVLIKTNFISAEIEADYMWGLLHPSLLSGEGGYYLTTLSSAVQVLKTLKESSQENIKNNSDVSAFQSVLKVVVPDELHGSILTKTLPARPQMTTKEVCKIIAHKARITNPQDFALYRLEDGEETMLGDNECPQDFMNKGKHVMLAYKRIDAKIAWPRHHPLSN